jgi:hypothetical protein
MDNIRKAIPQPLAVGRKKSLHHISKERKKHMQLSTTTKGKIRQQVR